ncbi:MAG: hypothetical protein HGA44_15800 [Cellulomonadaceae bacterium]|nr:hypothetical protein [Cellulomonadaceae bacterium]
MIACIPVTPSGQVDPRWGKAQRVAFATVTDGAVATWEELEVGWDVAHDEGSEGSHHARVARVLIEHGVEAVVANHMGPGMVRMLATMSIPVHLGAQGDARTAVLTAATGPDA